MTDSKLNIKQQKFISEYLVDSNATKAAIRAGYSEKTAHSQGPRLLENVEIKGAIEKAKQAVAKKCSVILEELIMEYKRIAMFDIAKCYDERGQFKNIHDIDEDTRRAICGIETEELFAGVGEDRKLIGYVNKIKVVNKKDALSDLMKHIGGFKEDNAQKSNLEKTVAAAVAVGAAQSAEERARVLKRILQG